MMDGGFGFGIPGLGMVLFWGAIIVLVIVLVRLFSQPNPGARGEQQRQKSAREILDERYARGEIDQEEYEKKKRSLG
jgi:putative membrane protein